MLRPSESWLEVWLNGTQVGAVSLVPGAQLTMIALPADLLTTNNTLTLQIQGSCAACRESRRPWVNINPASQLHLSGTRLPLANDLALLPVPFFDSASQHSWSLPVVFSDRPNREALEAASVVASWFGIFSDFRGVRFPVSLGDLPHGNALVFAIRSSELAARLALPSRPGPLLAIRENPRDPFGKLLIIAGDQPEDLVTAARALVTRNNSRAHTDIAYVGPVLLATPREYEAPRWLEASRPAPIGMYTTAERLKVKGSGSVNIYFRIPPDLFLEARESVPLLLKYSYAGVADGSHAALHVRLNDRYIDSIRLTPAVSTVNREDIIRLPTGRLQPYTNTLSVDFDFGRSGGSAGVWQFAAIQRESSLDLSGLPHSVVLPRLELFAASGYPFTAWSNLGRTAIVLSQAPDTSEYETLLEMMGFFGAQTGAPATGVSISDNGIRDKDLILLGTPGSQPLFTEWADSMPLSLTRGLRLTNQPEPSRLLHAEWPYRASDREKLASLLATKPSLDLVAEDFVSPYRPDRCVVAIVPQGIGGSGAIGAMFTPALDKGPIYGGVAIAQNQRFQSFLVGAFAYHSGYLTSFQQTRVFLLEHYLFIPLLVVLLALILATWLHRSTERVAARRLAVGKT